MARGIFQKTCPSCATHVSIGEEQCDCGYSFRADMDVAELPTEDEQAQQQLLREYVNARLAQAMDILENLHATLLADPKNFDNANRLMKAYADVRGLRAELKALSVPENTAESIGTTEAPQAFRAAQAKKAEVIMQAAGMETKECGECHAILPERAVLCFCGYVFSRTATNAADTSTSEDTQRQGV